MESIKSQKEYEQALLKLEKVFDSPAESREGILAEQLVNSIETYEEQMEGW